MRTGDTVTLNNVRKSFFQHVSSVKVEILCQGGQLVSDWSKMQGWRMESSLLIGQ